MTPTPNAVAYAWRELCRRAGWTEALPGLAYGGHGDPRAPVRIEPAPSSAWTDLLEASRLPELDGLPMLFGAERFAELRGGQLVIFPDLIAGCLFQLTRWEEAAVDTRDEHGRFPGGASVAARTGVLERPLLDETARMLGDWLARRFPDWRPARRESRSRPSHDIDSLRAFPQMRVAWRRAGGDVVKRWNPWRALRTLRGGWNQDHDPFVLDLRRLATWSERHGFRGVFFFQTAEAGPFDEGYGAERSRPLVEEIQARGHTIGFHPGYRAGGDRAVFEAEKARADALIGGPGYPVRMHYLRLRAPETWRWMAAAGLREDWSLGYADRAGFRAGTCWPFRPFDLEADRELDVEVVPLIAMEGTLKQRMGLDPRGMVDKALALAGRCRAVGGDFVFLWHNSSFIFEWDEYVPAYAEILDRLAALAGRGKDG